MKILVHLRGENDPRHLVCKGIRRNHHRLTLRHSGNSRFLASAPKGTSRNEAERKDVRAKCALGASHFRGRQAFSMGSSVGRVRCSRGCKRAFKVWYGQFCRRCRKIVNGRHRSSEREQQAHPENGMRPRAVDNSNNSYDTGILTTYKGIVLMPKRRGNDPKRFIAKIDHFDQEELKRFSELAQYRGSPNHLRKPQAKGFPARTQRPDQSLCDGNISLKLPEANQLLQEGISRSMISTTLRRISTTIQMDLPTNVLPKYVWAVKDKHVFEAKLSGHTSEYHGYELPKSDLQRNYVMNVWKKRCLMN